MQLRFLVSGIFVVSLAIYHQSTNSQGWQHQCVALISFVSSGRAMECERVGAAKRRRESGAGSDGSAHGPNKSG